MGLLSQDQRQRSDYYRKPRTSEGMIHLMARRLTRGESPRKRIGIQLVMFLEKTLLL